MTAQVIGGTGYIGGAVVRRLFVGGHEPVVLVRDPGARFRSGAVPGSSPPSCSHWPFGHTGCELETEADDPTPAVNLGITHQGKDQP